MVIVKTSDTFRGSFLGDQQVTMSLTLFHIHSWCGLVTWNWIYSSTGSCTLYAQVVLLNLLPRFCVQSHTTKENILLEPWVLPGASSASNFMRGFNLGNCLDHIKMSKYKYIRSTKLLLPRSYHWLLFQNLAPRSDDNCCGDQQVTMSMAATDTATETATTDAATNTATNTAADTPHSLLMRTGHLKLNWLFDGLFHAVCASRTTEPTTSFLRAITHYKVKQFARTMSTAWGFKCK